jgi:hypothetical protein
MGVRFAQQLVNMDLFTDAYRVTGRALVGTGGLHSELGNPNRSFVELEDAYVSRIHQPGEIVVSFKETAFRKDSINFIVLQNRREGVPLGSQSFTRGRPISIFLTVPSFEIRGEIYHEGKLAAQDVVGKAYGRFLLIFSAKASASLYPDISYSGDLILVHRDRVGILGLS